MQCAKIVLPSQIVILSTTNSKYHFLGAIFSGVSLMSISFYIIIYFFLILSCLLMKLFTRSRGNNCFFYIFTIWLISEWHRIRCLFNLSKLWNKGSKSCCEPKEHEIRGKRPIMRSSCNNPIKKLILVT